MHVWQKDTKKGLISPNCSTQPTLTHSQGNAKLMALVKRSSRLLWQSLLLPNNWSHGLMPWKANIALRSCFRVDNYLNILQRASSQIHIFFHFLKTYLGWEILARQFNMPTWRYRCHQIRKWNEDDDLSACETLCSTKCRKLLFVYVDHYYHIPFIFTIESRWIPCSAIIFLWDKLMNF